jgi:hypothetical protein
MNGHLNATDHQTASTSPRCVLLPKTVTSALSHSSGSSRDSSRDSRAAAAQDVMRDGSRRRETRAGLETQTHLEPLVCFFFFIFFDYTNVHLQITIFSHRCTQQP